jgi:hypothetical protein
LFVEVTDLDVGLLCKGFNELIFVNEATGDGDSA